MKPFVFNQWHAWQGNTHVVLSDESKKELHYFSFTDDCINWLYLNGDKEAARALNAHVKAK